MSISEMQQNGAVVRGPDDGTQLWLLGHYCNIKAYAEHTNGHMSMMDATLGPQLLAAPPHIHGDTDEGFYVLDGTVRFQAGDEQIEATPGTFLFVPRGTVHGFGNDTANRARCLVFHFPPGVEGFYEEIGEPAKEATLPPPPQGPPDFERIMAAAARYEMEILGPPPGADGPPGAGGPPPPR